MLVQVSLLNRGGMSGGSPAAHADGVLKGLKEIRRSIRVEDSRREQVTAACTIVCATSRSGGRNGLAHLADSGAAIAAVAAITGIKPRGTRHVAHTSLMGVARAVLVVIIIIVVYLALRARSGA